MKQKLIVATAAIFSCATTVLSFQVSIPTTSPSLRSRQSIVTTTSQRFTRGTTTLSASEPSEETSKSNEEVSLCIIGGGVSGLTAAVTATESASMFKKNIVLLEASPTLGGRVQTDVTPDGFLLDRGFAVFIEQYPMAKLLLNYQQLDLRPFQPGALVTLPPSENDVSDDAAAATLARVADPLRQPSQLLTALLAPVGTLVDKLRVLFLLSHVFGNSIQDLFEEPETSTLSALIKRWGFGQTMVEQFYKPFLEGIYLAPLQDQSSRMFSFVFKMFSEGSATLPRNGMGAISQQLADRANECDLRVQQKVKSITRRDDGTFDVHFVDTTTNNNEETTSLHAQSVIVATESPVAERLLSNLDGFEQYKIKGEKSSSSSRVPQRQVGCLYYTFEGPPPVKDPILILSGYQIQRGTPEKPINNLCFPSVVQPSYAPEGKHLCSVTILKPAMDHFFGPMKNDNNFVVDENDENFKALDEAVRAQLGEFFPDFRQQIQTEWEFKQMYRIPYAQPAQYGGNADYIPANVNGGQAAGTFQGQATPEGLMICGDHMATATLNGALESGRKAGEEAVKYISQQ